MGKNQVKMAAVCHGAAGKKMAGDVFGAPTGVAGNWFRFRTGVLVENEGEKKKKKGGKRGAPSGSQHPRLWQRSG